MRKVFLILVFGLWSSWAAAGIYWLPDYLKDNIDTNHRTETDTGGGDQINTCAHYNTSWTTTVSEGMTCDEMRPIQGLTCYANCRCDSKYQYNASNCDPAGYNLTGGQCNGKYTVCSAKSCTAGYIAGQTCSEGYRLEKSGQSGSQYCGKCIAKSCSEANNNDTSFTPGLANCNGKAHPDGWTYTGGKKSGEQVCGKCTAKSCTSGTAGLANCQAKAHPEGWDYSPGGYAGDNICGTCRAKSCPAGYTAGVTQCSNTTSWTYGSNGYTGDSICGKCSEKGCADGFTKGLANCSGKTYPSGWNYTAGTASGNTACGKCTAKTCTAGSTSCNTSTQNAAANGYYAGDSICYTCTNKTCEQMGQKTCNGTCIAKSQCCNGCPSGQECQNGTCVNIQLSCIDQFFKDNPSVKSVSESFDDGDAIVLYYDDSDKYFDISLLNGRQGIIVFNGVCGNNKKLSGVLQDAYNITFYDSGQIHVIDVRNSGELYFNGISGAELISIESAQINLDFVDSTEIDVRSLDIGPGSYITFGSDFEAHVNFDSITFRRAFDSGLSLMTPISVWFNNIYAYGWTDDWQAEYNPNPASIYVNSASSFQGDKITLGDRNMNGGGDLIFENEGSLYLTHIDFARTNSTDYHDHVNQLVVNNSGTFITMYDDYTVGDAYFFCEGQGRFLYNSYGGVSYIFQKSGSRQCTMDCSKLTGWASFDEENVSEFCN